MNLSPTFNKLTPSIWKIPKEKQHYLYFGLRDLTEDIHISDDSYLFDNSFEATTSGGFQNK